MKPFYENNHLLKADELAAHLNGFDDGDLAMVERRLLAAQNLIERQLGFKIASRFGGEEQEPVPEALRHAVLLLVAHWYENREATLVGVSAQPLPFGVGDIVAEFRDYSFG